MIIENNKQTIKQLDPRKGGYNYLELSRTVVDQMNHGRSTRLLVTIDENVIVRCGLNHLGNGDFFIIVSKRHLDELKKEKGDVVSCKIQEDPDQLGVDVPEVLSVLLEQDQYAHDVFERLTDGKKRSLIYGIVKIKNVDLQVKRILEFLEKEALKLK